MLAWVAAAALLFATSAVLSLGSFSAVTASGQGVAFLLMAVSALVFFGALDAYEGGSAKSGPDPSEDADLSKNTDMVDDFAREPPNLRGGKRGA